MNKKESHPSLDKTNRKALDQLIREQGFRIVSRQLNKEPIWERFEDHKWKKYKQSIILPMLNEHDLADAEYMEALYFDGFQS